MPAVVWPSTLPQTPTIGYERIPLDSQSVVKFKTDTGPGQIAVRTSAKRWLYRVTLDLTMVQVTILDGLLDTLGVYGEFEWDDFMDTEDVTPRRALYRFLNGRPAIKNVTPATLIEKRRAIMTFDLEFLRYAS